jgi:hypothetical protein
VTTGVVAVIVGSTNFAKGAWIAMAAIIVLGSLLWAIYRHYTSVHAKLRIEAAGLFGMEKKRRQALLIPVDEINRAVIRTVDYARTLSANVTAIHVTDDPEQGQQFKRDWETRILDVPLALIISPYRSSSPRCLVSRRSTRPTRRSRRRCRSTSTAGMAALAAQRVGAGFKNALMSG